jgi:hypothetical protein
LDWDLTDMFIFMEINREFYHILHKILKK